MNPTTFKVQNLIVVVALLTPFGGVGCGSTVEESPTTLTAVVPVDGIVFVNGRPLRRGKLSFEGPCMGRTTTDAKGRFAQVKSEMGDKSSTGLVPGTYQVSMVGGKPTEPTILLVPKGGLKGTRIELKTIGGASPVIR